METETVKLQTTSVAIPSFMVRVYSWMSVGLLLSAATAYLVFWSGLFLSLSRFWWLIFLIELVLVVVITGAINRLSSVVASILFIIYSLLNGLVFGVIIAGFTLDTVFFAFGVTAGTFLVMSGYGVVTGRDLTKFGNLAFMALIGLIIASVINVFVGSSGLSLILSYLGVIIFVALIAYDSKKLKKMAEQGGNMFKLSIVGALILYLDFVNLFLRILMIFGNNRR